MAPRVVRLADRAIALSPDLQLDALDLASSRSGHRTATLRLFPRLRGGGQMWSLGMCGIEEEEGEPDQTFRKGLAEHALEPPPVPLPLASELSGENGRKTLWEERGGAEIEAVLGVGAVALLDAHWMVELAKQGGVLSPRQKLPPEAFLSLSDIKRAVSTTSTSLPIVCVSHCWLQPDHPDPRGHNLNIITRALDSMLCLTDFVTGESKFPRLAVLYDYCSLHQGVHGSYVETAQEWLPARSSRAQLATESVLFRQALSSLGIFYSHPHTFTFMLTAFPPDYDNPEVYHRSGNSRPYFERGWCFCESSWSMMVKNWDMVLDLGKDIDALSMDWAELRRRCRQGRKAPLVPTIFEAQLLHKGFTNGRTDFPRVARLYREGFHARFRDVTSLYYSDLGWGDSEAMALGTLLESCVATKLATLDLGSNLVGDAGASALAKSLVRAPLLRKLDFNFNSIGDVGAAMIAKALCHLPLLQRLCLSSNSIGDAGAAALAKALPRATSLRDVILDSNNIGDEGAMTFARFVPDAHELRRLDLDSNKIGEAGAITLARALGDALAIERISLYSNPIGDAGAAAMAEATRGLDLVRRYRRQTTWPMSLAHQVSTSSQPLLPQDRHPASMSGDSTAVHATEADLDCWGF